DESASPETSRETPLPTSQPAKPAPDSPISLEPRTQAPLNAAPSGSTDTHPGKCRTRKLVAPFPPVIPRESTRASLWLDMKCRGSNQARKVSEVHPSDRPQYSACSFRIGPAPAHLPSIPRR